MAIERRGFFKYVGGCFAALTIPSTSNIATITPKEVKTKEDFNVVQPEYAGCCTGDFGNGIEIKYYKKNIEELFENSQKTA